MLNLPEEIIVMILVHLFEGPEISESFWPLRSSSNEWLHFVKTCRRVYEIAISAQQLWRLVTIRSLNMSGLESALIRSGDGHIDILFDFRDTQRISDGIQSVLDILVSDAIINRVRTLVIVQADPRTDLTLKGFFAKNKMPSLTTLQVHLVHKPIPGYDPYDDEDGSPPEACFSGELWHTRIPGLLSLQLSKVPFNWGGEKGGEILKNLRRLSLRNSAPQDFDSFLTLKEFLNLLKACVNLENLELWSSSPFDLPVVETHDLKVIHLPKLRTLILGTESHEEHPGTMELLPLLRLTEEVDLTVSLEIDKKEDMNLTLLDTMFQTRNPSTLLVDTISQTHNPLLFVESATSASLSFSRELHLKISRNGQLHVRIAPYGESDTIERGLDWQPECTPSQAVEKCCGLLEHAPLSKLELRLEWPSHNEACAADGTFNRVFQAFPELEELVYCGHANDSKASDMQFLDALRDTRLPHLRTLRLEHWNEGLVPSLITTLEIRAEPPWKLRLTRLDVQLMDTVAAGPEAVLLPASEANRLLQELVDGDVRMR